jgi:tRNA threonylcarbamoyladenosine biosynthesis protein TsaB
MSTSILLLGVDTCGPSGSVALARSTRGELEVLSQRELAGRTYSASLVATVRELLSRARAQIAQLGAIVVVNGPGSFTGLRVGLSAVKGLAGPANVPVLAVSRLAALANKAQLLSAAIDAHRREVFLRLGGGGTDPRELLAGRRELALISSPPGVLSACDETAASLVSEVWPRVEIVRVAPPTAADALELAVPRVLTGDFIDVTQLDGNYLRRSDAEIFGQPAAETAQQA